MFAIHQCHPNVWQITLPLPQLQGQLPQARPINVYLIKDEHRAPVLINTGHPSQWQALSAALRSIDVSIEHVERVIATSWQLDTLGAAPMFSFADVYAFSPDMIAPRAYNDWITSHRDAHRAHAEALLEHEPWLAKREDHEVTIERYFTRAYPRVSNQLDVSPLREGHVVRAGGLALEVMAMPGPDEGHLCLWEPQQKLLFTGHLSMDGMPERVDSMQDYMATVERVVTYEPALILPNHGAVDKWGKMTLRRAGRFMSNFVSNVPHILQDRPTLLDIVEQDIGYRPEDVVRFGATMQAFEVIMEELAQARMIDVAGKGSQRRYGSEDDKAHARTNYPT